MRGYGMSGDAHHVVSPEPTGHGARLSMTRALARAGARPKDICYVNAHATSTPVGENPKDQLFVVSQMVLIATELNRIICTGAGDEIELRAIADIFNSSDRSTAVSSTKGATGQLPPVLCVLHVSGTAHQPHALPQHLC